MADLIEVVQWESGIYQLEENDPVLGGPAGISNRQAKLLANRTAWLKAQVEAALTAIAGIGTDPTLPTGTIVYVPRATAPSGAIKANGPLLSRITYADLWAYAQASGNIVSEAVWPTRPGSFSTGDGANTFRAPLLLGVLIRGYHDGLGTYETDTARALGSYQADELKAHSHYLKVRLQSGTSNPEVPSDSTGTYTEAAQATAETGGAETRGRNVALLPVIYY